MPAPSDVIRSYGGGAVASQLIESMGPTDTSFAINPTTGWTEADGNPLGTVGPFVVVIDRFTDTVEKILCSSINLVTGLVTVYTSSGYSGRGYDGSTPQAHVPGGSTSGVQTCWSSVEAVEANAAVNALLGQSPTAGQVLSWNGSAPAYESISGQQSTSLYGVGTSIVGGTPPPRLTGAFLVQKGFISPTFSSGIYGLSFPQAFPTGVLAINLTASNATPTTAVQIQWYDCTLIAVVVTGAVGGAAYSGALSFSYEITGW